MGIILGYVLLAIWFLMPAIKISRSISTSTTEKIIWIFLTFLPHTILLGGTYLAVNTTDIVEYINIQARTGVDYFKIFFAIFFFLGGWPILAIHDSLYNKRCRRLNNLIPTCPKCKGKLVGTNIDQSTKNHWVGWLIVIFLFILWWPAGVVSFLFLPVYNQYRVKKEKIYSCNKCNINLSFNEVMENIKYA